MNNKYKISNLINELTKDLHERDDAIKLALLALLSNESIFLLGPPGVAKSLVSRKIKEGIKDASNFEYLMNKFSTPDEIFGPISLKKLDEDIYERKVEGYLPSAQIAFLDEIWKASPSIQNTLLTIINEKLYQNGNQVIKVPLLLLIAASNELPLKNQGLEALYDRFTIRLYVNNIQSMFSFRELLEGNYEVTALSDDQKLSIEEIKRIQEVSKTIRIDDDTFFFIKTLKQELEKLENPPYISDRRWKKIANILRVATVASNESIIEPYQWTLVQNMVWDDLEQIKDINDCIENAFSEALFHKYHLNSIKKVEQEILQTTNRIGEDFDHHTIEPELTNNFKRGPLHVYQNENKEDDFLVAQIIKTSSSNYDCTYREKVKLENIDFRNEKVITESKKDNCTDSYTGFPRTINYWGRNYTLYKYTYATGDINLTDEIKNEYLEHVKKIESLKNDLSKITRDLNGKETLFSSNYQKFIAKFEVIWKDKLKQLNKLIKDGNEKVEKIILDIKHYGA